MKPVSILACILSVLILAACLGPEMIQLPIPSQVLTQTIPTHEPTQIFTQEATLFMRSSETPAPNPTQPGIQSTSQPGLSGSIKSPFSPQPGDEKMRPGPVFLDQSVVVLMESFPPKVAVHLIGNLPTPCNNLRVKITGPDQEKQINLEVYSMVATDIICVQSLAPFDESILLGSFPSGKYSVWVNGKAIGNFEMP